jgi:hypothetical protein
MLSYLAQGHYTQETHEEIRIGDRWVASGRERLARDRRFWRLSPNAGEQFR